MIGTMGRGSHVRTPAAVRAWRYMATPAVSRWLTLTLLLIMAAAAGSLMVLTGEHREVAGLIAAAVLGSLCLAGTAFCPRWAAWRREQDITRKRVVPELTAVPGFLPAPRQGAAVPGFLSAPHQGAAVPGLDDVFPDKS